MRSRDERLFAVNHPLSRITAFAFCAFLFDTRVNMSYFTLQLPSFS